MRRAIVVLAFFILSSLNLAAQERTFISPGVKFGYAFGNNGGFVFGMEVSFVVHSDDWFYGAVISFDRINENLILHAGLETTTPEIIGIEIGPSLLLNDKKSHFGFGVTPYTGFLLLPYANFSTFTNGNNFFQVGSYLKIPVQTAGPNYSFGG